MAVFGCVKIFIFFVQLDSRFLCSAHDSCLGWPGGGVLHALLDLCSGSSRPYTYVKRMTEVTNVKMDFNDTYCRS